MDKIKNQAKNGFTLAEVLITLSIIGVVAALTISAVIKNYRETELKTQFKKTYSTLQRSIAQAQVKMGYKPDCYFWDKSPYGASKCLTRDAVTGYCTKYVMDDEDESNRPADIDGPYKDCTDFKNNLRATLNVAKYCSKNALANGCITSDYKGLDTVYKDSNENATDYDAGGHCSNGNWTKANIENSKEVWTLTDGTVILQGWRAPIVFAVDVNGAKKPNKWGHDIFLFYVRGNLNNPLKLVPSGATDAVEKGGYTTTTMLKNSLK